MVKQPSISERLRAAILAAPQSRRQIALATGVQESSLCRFLQRRTSLDLATVDALAGYLGLDLVPMKQSKRR